MVFREVSAKPTAAVKKSKWIIKNKQERNEGIKLDVLPFCRPMVRYHLEKFMLPCSCHHRKDVRRTRKDREKGDKAGESCGAIAA